MEEELKEKEEELKGKEKTLPERTKIFDLEVGIKNLKESIEKEENAMKAATSSFTDIQPGDRVNVVVYDNTVIPGIVTPVGEGAFTDTGNIVVEFDKEYLREFDFIDWVNVTPDDNNVKLLYQSLQNMKRKYFNINVPNFATADFEGNKDKDLKLHLYVNEKLEFVGFVL